MSRSQYMSPLAVIGLGLIQAVGANAAPAWKPTGNVLTWADGATVTIDGLDCAKSGYSGLVVGGTVTLVHPKAHPDASQTIRLLCPYVQFRNGAQLRTKEALDVKITVQVAGPVKITNTRGEKGEDAAVEKEIWEVTKKPKARDGNPGGNGNNARTDFKGDWDADEGGRGNDGDPGARGENGRIGNPGRAGKSAARIHVRVADFADQSTIVLQANGGNGGTGGKGGRGQNGGDGGAGGTGGRGGNGNAVHNGASGGNGGNGGNGGDGGDGGQGGQGGPGGNGADVIVFLLKSAQPPEDLDLSAEGGYGGGGGEGGDYGMEGRGGGGGQAGCGGDGGKFLWKTGGGSCGTNGVKGRDGVRGKKGPPGAFGTDGSPGNNKLIDLRQVSPAEF
jgi:hypothetical protein